MICQKLGGQALVKVREVWWPWLKDRDFPAVKYESIHLLCKHYCYQQ